MKRFLVTFVFIKGYCLTWQTKSNDRNLYDKLLIKYKRLIYLFKSGYLGALVLYALDFGHRTVVGKWR